MGLINKDFDFSIRTEDPLEIKDRMLELQNDYSEVCRGLALAKLDRDSLEAALGYIRDRSFLEVTGTVEERKSRSKVEVTVEVSYLSKGSTVKKELTYHNCKYLLFKAEARVNRLWFYLEELKSAIDVCRAYPVRGF